MEPNPVESREPHLEEYFITTYSHWLQRAKTMKMSDPEDAVGEAFVILLRKAGQYDRRAKFSTWAFAVVIHSLIDQMRRQRRALAGAAQLQKVSLPGPAGGDYDQELCDRPAALYRALATLPGELRVVMEGLLPGGTSEEVREMLGVARSTFGNRKQRAVAAFLQALRAQGLDEVADAYMKTASGSREGVRGSTANDRTGDTSHEETT